MVYIANRTKLTVCVQRRESQRQPLLPVEFSPVPVAVIRATWSTPILSASSVARVYVSSANNMVA